MDNRLYHHGNLRRTLIETGIEMINSEGEGNLSLRKIAEKCGVSNAAPYAHFKNKEEFIAAMQQHIMEQFEASLEKTTQENADDPALTSKLGKAYVMFFYENPLYFHFLFSRKNININLSLDNSNEIENPPLAILQKTVISIFGKQNLSERAIQNKTIAMWAFVHGLAAIVTMPGVRFDGEWETRIEEIIHSLSAISPDKGGRK